MTPDLFDQLADADVPPVPVDFDQHVHQRVNETLLGIHVAEVLFQVVPYAVLHFARAVGGLIACTITGRYPNDRGESDPPSRPSAG